MNRKHPVLNVFGVIFAVLLSLLLIPTLITAPVINGMAGLVQPEFLQSISTEIVEEVDLAEIIASDPEAAQALAESGLTEEAVAALMESQFVRDILQLVGQDLAQVAQGTFTVSALSESELLRLVEVHKEELIAIFRLLDPEATAALSDSDMGEMVDLIVQEELVGLSGELNGVMPELQNTLYGEGSVLPILISGILTWELVGLAFVLALLIFLCRLRHQEGFLWLGIDTALAALPVLLIGMGVKGAQIRQLLTQQIPAPDIFDPIIRRFGSSTLIGGAILLALAAVFIASFVLLRDRRLKKEAVAEAQLPEIV